jgi:predicted phage gp36 major capsid-like protein
VLIPNDLSSRLEQEWLGQFPDSSMQSGDMFAGAVSGWFATSMALTFPCATAVARRAQLAAAAAAALEAGIGPTSGALLAVAVASYYAGQVYGTGVATFPVALPSGILLMTAALLDLDMPKSARAMQMAQACHVMAISTMVVFAVPPSSGPIF